MNQDQRVIYETSDISTGVNDFRTGSAVIPYDTGESLYVGSVLPFNNLYIDLSTPNTQEAVMGVEVWWAKSWVSVVDLVDETVGLTVDGRVSFNIDYLKGWDAEDRSDDVTGLSGFSIYEKYWARISFSADLDDTTEINYIGQKFSNDGQLYDHYPDFQRTDLLESFEAGKTSWEDQHFMATDQIIRDLKRQNIIESRSQLMDYSLFEDAACHKVATFIYRSLGTPYFDQLQQAQKDYQNALNMKRFGVDLNRSGSLEGYERSQTTQFVTR